MKRVERAKVLNQNLLPDKCQEISKGKSKVLKRDPNSRSRLGSPISVSIPELQHSWAFPNPRKDLLQNQASLDVIHSHFFNPGLKSIINWPWTQTRVFGLNLLLIKATSWENFSRKLCPSQFWGHGKSRFNDQLERPGQMCSFRCYNSAIPLCSFKCWRGVLLQWMMDSKKTVRSKSTVY